MVKRLTQFGADGAALFLTARGEDFFPEVVREPLIDEAESVNCSLVIHDTFRSLRENEVNVLRRVNSMPDMSLDPGAVGRLIQAKLNSEKLHLSMMSLKETILSMKESLKVEIVETSRQTLVNTDRKIREVERRLHRK